MKTVEIGRIGEDAAAKFLKKQGYKIIVRNVRFSHNEIDIIASDCEFLVFAEVKTRTEYSKKPFNYGTPASSVDFAKQKRQISAAYAYLRENPTTKQPRMDVIEVLLDENTGEVKSINHIRNAYGG